MTTEINKSKENQKVDNSLFDKIWKSASSLKTAIVLLIILAIASLSGIFIIQENEAIREAQRASQEMGTKITTNDVYQTKYGTPIATIIKTLGLNKVFHTLWYAFILGLITINLIICSITKIGNIYKTTFSTSFLNNRADYKDRKYSAYIKIDGNSISNVKDKVIIALKKNFYRFKIMENDNSISISGRKGEIGRFGWFITHISLILILIGGIINVKYGKEEYFNGVKGDKISLRIAPFEIRVDSVYVEYYDEAKREIKQYYSKLTVIEHNKEVLTKTIYVNEPLVYKGYRFYQSNYGEYPASGIFHSGLLNVKKKDDPNFKVDISINLDEPVSVPNTDLKVKATRFVPDFVIGSDGVDTRSFEDRNPALHIEVSKGDSLLFKRWLFARFPDFHRSKEEDYSLTLVDYDYHKIIDAYTGIQVAKEPGSPFLWISFLLMTIGVLISFYIYYRKVWILIVPDENKSDVIEVFIAGYSNKNQLGLESEVKKLGEMIKMSVKN